MPRTVTDTVKIFAPEAVDGHVIGQDSASLVALYGVTPVVQPSGASEAAVTKTLATALATAVFSAAYTGMWAYSSSTAAKLVVTRINQAKVDVGALTILVNKLRADLVALGAVKGGA